MVQSHTYTDGIYNKRVLLIGTVPPPYGGVSVHVERSKKKLEQQGNRLIVFDPGSIYLHPVLNQSIVRYGAYGWYFIRLLSVLLIHRPHVIVYHLSYARQVLPELWLLHTIKIIMASQVLLIDHDCRHMALRSDQWVQRYARLLRAVDHLVLIGSLTARSYMARGVNAVTLTSIESAFLPPNIAQRESLMREYPASLWNFLSQHIPVIIMNAYHCVVWNGKDLYGFDLAIQSVSLLRTEYPQAGLVILLSTIGDHGHYAQVLSQISALGLEDHLYILHGNYQLWPLFFHTDVFIRPTRSDGASVSVEEALYCAIPVIASDVCWRPAMVLTYYSEDVVDLCRALKVALLNRNKGVSYVDSRSHYLHAK